MISNIKLFIAAAFGILIVAVRVLLGRNKALKEEVEAFEKKQEIREEHDKVVEKIEDEEGDKVKQHIEDKPTDSRADRINRLLNNKADS